MTYRTWWGRWVAWAWADDEGPPRRSRARATLELDRLPDRDLPYALVAGPAVLPPLPPAVPMTARWEAASSVPPTPAANSFTPPTFVDAVVPPSMKLAPAVPPTPAEGGRLEVVVAPATPPPNVEVTPTAPSDETANKTPLPAGAGKGPVRGPVVVGQLASPDTPVFRVAGQVGHGETLRVNYTLTAHDGTGSTSATGSVTLTPAASVATIPAGTVAVGRTPDVLTLVVHDAPGVRPVRPSATLFLTPPQKVGDATLFEAHKLGRSAEAFNVLLRRHGPAVTQAVQRVVVNRTDAQDVSQFVFLELSKFRGQFSGSLTAWLRTVSRHAALAFLRAKRRRLRHEQRAAKAVAAEAPPPAAVDEGLIVALGQLPPDQMEAVRLRYLEGYTQQEAAELVGCPRGTLSRRAADGIQALRAILVDDAERPAAERH